jgi:hypothetical protein
MRGDKDEGLGHRRLHAGGAAAPRRQVGRTTRGSDVAEFLDRAVKES